MQVGVVGVAGVVNDITKTFLHAKNVWKVCEKVANAIEMIADNSETLEKLLNENKTLRFAGINH
jgi:hypothetical protein